MCIRDSSLTVTVPTRKLRTIKLILFAVRKVTRELEFNFENENLHEAIFTPQKRGLFKMNLMIPLHDIISLLDWHIPYEEMTIHNVSCV